MDFVGPRLGRAWCLLESSHRPSGAQVFSSWPEARNFLSGSFFVAPRRVYVSRIPMFGGAALIWWWARAVRWFCGFCGRYGSLSATACGQNLVGELNKGHMTFGPLLRLPSAAHRLCRKFSSGMKDGVQGPC